ncbi:MAG TPA: ATP-binding domain-containing protein [Nocardioidaceae bacterium]|nr:ATP-binding domain-containing protein [Nocardioidaceae bacterium]
MSGRRSAEQLEVEHEQDFVDHVYKRLDAAADAARAVAADGHARGRLGNDGGLVERDAMVFQAAKRLATLDAAHDGLVFGRLDLADDAEPRYVGRIGLRDEHRDIMLVDWRAPAASVFYQATAADPRAVVRRRVLRCLGPTVVSIEDELLDADAAPEDMVVIGEGALMAELSRARDTRMHSVVATIQKEQDDAIRAPARGVTTISGGPGTGKTVVALHRAAYLLYSDRRRFEGGGVLVVGPSDVFMSYIARVLPSLGETSVTLRALGEVVDGVRAARHDRPDVAAVKGSARMATVLKRLVRAAVPGAPDRLRIFYRDDVLRLDADDLRMLRRQLLAGNRRNRVGERAGTMLLDALWRQVAGERALERRREDFDEEVGGSEPFTTFVEQWWPVLDAVEVLGWLEDPEQLQDCAAGLLDADEVELLLGAWHTATAGAGLTIEDVPLVDELRYLLGDPIEEMVDYDPTVELQDVTVHEVTTADDRRGGPALGQRSPRLTTQRPTQRTEDDPHAHVLVDEAQDLSPMQWRMIGRRGRYASWTIVGDAAQSSWPHPDEAGAARATALEGKDEHRFRLSTNYRNSAEIYDLAAAYASAHVPEADLPDAVRRTGIEPVHRTVSPSDLAEQTRSLAAELADAVDGTVGVVVPLAREPEVAQWLDGLVDERVRLLGPLDTKGLEFDAVLVVQPAEVAQESIAGHRTLYVVLTRATQLLATVSTTGWPPD